MNSENDLIEVLDDNISNNNNNNNNKKSTISVIIILLLLFIFVFFLPNITDLFKYLKNEITGANELKSGNMICTYNNSTDNIDYTYDLTFKYEKNRLKSSKMVTTSRLSDKALDGNILKKKEASCEQLSKVVRENKIGMTTDCSLSAAVQITTQNIDYEHLNLNFINSNLGEFDGFYPSYKLNQSVTVIAKELENSGYTCKRNERYVK